MTTCHHVEIISISTAPQCFNGPLSGYDKCVVLCGDSVALNWQGEQDHMITVICYAIAISIDMEQWTSWSCVLDVMSSRLLCNGGVEEQTYADGWRWTSSFSSYRRAFQFRVLPSSSQPPRQYTPEIITIYQNRLRHFESNESFLHNKESILICFKLKFNNTITFNQTNKIRPTKIQSSSAKASQWAEK